MTQEWQTSYDQIRVTGIRATGRHGVLAAEREQGQEFVVDVVLGVDVRQAPHDDDLAETVDYADVAQRVHAIVSGPAVNLIETLAQRIADACLSLPYVGVVEVVVHKPEAPIPVPFADVSVRIVRWRPRP